MFAASKSGQSVVAAATDPFFQYVPLLLETTTTNGQQNNTFLDSSTNNFTITRNGTPTQGSVTPYWPNGYWSTNLNGSTDTLTTVSGAMSYAGDFSIECWFNTTTTTTYACLYSDETGSTGGTILLNNGANNGQIVVFIGSAVSTFTSTSTGLNNGTWNHVALTRSGSTVRLFINGALQNTTTASGTITTTSTVRIGSSFFASRFFNGYISNFRIVVGAPVYTAAFTPSTTPLTATQSANVNGNPSGAITGTQTSLLTCQSNRFIDNSANARTITVVSAPQVQAFQPFNPTAPYTAAAYGGSGYFDGGSNLTWSNTSSAFGSNSFAIELWVYFLSNTGGYKPVIANQGTADQQGWVIITETTNALTFYGSSGSAWAVGNITSSYVPAVNTWTHIVVTRDNSQSTQFRMFANGALIGSATSTTAMGSGSLNTSLGYYAYFPGGGRYLNAYCGNVRIINGSVPSAYQTSSVTVGTQVFAPPTGPLAAVSNTSLLLNFTDAGIYDAAAQNNQLTVANAQVSTTTSKWPPTSIKFNGTTDYLSMAAYSGLDFGTGNFTIEFWAYLTTTATALQSFCQFGDSTTTAGLNLLASTNTVILSTNSATRLTTTGTITAGVWTHIALTRASGVTRIFINGTTSGGTYTWTANLASGITRWVGADRYSHPMNGYIQDFRVTKGIARYTANFTPPTSAFPTR